MTKAENRRPSGGVPVSKAETPSGERVLPVSKPATTGGGAGNPEPVAQLLGGPDRTESPRQRADRLLWEMEATAELMAAGLPPGSPQSKLTQARWQAARALLLELLDGSEPAPPDRQPLAFRGEGDAEMALIGALVKRHGWRVMVPGVLVRPVEKADA